MMVELGKRWKKGYVLALAFFLLMVPCLAYMRTRAAVAIDTEKSDCSITVSVEGSDFQEDFDEMSIPVSLYKVADVDATGAFTAVGAFSGMDFGRVDDKTTAEDWMRLAGEAAGRLNGTGTDGVAGGAGGGEDVGDIGAAGGGTIGAVATVQIEKVAGGAGAAEGVFKNLETGMYLVVPQATYNADYSVKYVFTPYLTALPSSEYTLSGTGSDDWDYDTVIGLKAEAEPQYGKLAITKTLENFNESLGRATFVFQIEGRDAAGVLVYSDVASITFGQAGSETVTIDRIPAGLTVTVTEIYSGASYTIVGSDTESVLIWSDVAVEATAGTENAAKQAAVSFTNRYDGGNRGGYGVTNHFESDGEDGWVWENPTE